MRMLAAPVDLPGVPARPADRGAILFGLAAAAVFFGFIGLWGVTASLTSAAVAPARVRVDSHRKTVQHLEGGIVREILVKDGDLVETGQILLRLDKTQSQSTFDQLRGQLDAQKALEARLIAERDGLGAIEFPPTLRTRRRTDPAVDEILAGQETIFATRRRTLDGQVEILDLRIEQLKAEIAGYQAQVSSLIRQSALIRDEIQGVAELVAKALERKPRLLALQREAAKLEGDRGQQLQLIAKAHQGIGEARMQIVDLENKRANEVAAELREVQTKVAETEEKLRAAEDVKTRTEVRAPVAGRVVNLRYFTPGGVIKAGESILDLVPQGDKLVLEAELRPLDIEAVHAGLPAEVRLIAYKQRRTPTLRGTVVYVSADALTDERTGQPYYAARITIPPEQLAQVEGVELYPGMPAEAMVITGERSPLQYLLDPIRDSFWRSLHEK